MRGERFDAIERRGLRDDGLQRQPLVDDERIVGVSGVEIVERGSSLGNIAVARASRARPCGRSCCRRSCIGARRAQSHQGVSPRPGGRARHCGARAVRRRRRRGGKGRCRQAGDSVRSSASARCSPTVWRSAVRAARMASGSTSRPISRAMSASPGSESASATKAGSSVASARIAASASSKPVSCAHVLARRGPPPRCRPGAGSRASAPPASD